MPVIKTLLEILESFGNDDDGLPLVPQNPGLQ